MANEPSSLSHFDDEGRARMVDVGDKDVTKRVAVATGRIRMQRETADTIRNGTAKKGDVLGVAQVAAIMATKRTSDLVPMCHPLMITGVNVALACEDDAVTIRAEVRTDGKTGVEMEALTAASVGLLTVYDMVKAIDRGMVIEAVQLESKTGGKSGTWTRESDVAPVGACVDGVCAVGETTVNAGVDLAALSSRLRNSAIGGTPDAEFGENPYAAPVPDPE